MQPCTSTLERHSCGKRFSRIRLRREDLHGSPALLWFSTLVFLRSFVLTDQAYMRSFSPGAGQRERAGVDGASQALLEVQEGGAGTEAAPQRGDPSVQTRRTGNIF
ncbi:unnamed protein product [Arctogadus glacialis]